MIKKFENFKEKKPTYKYGCVKIDLDIKNWEELISNIDPKDVYEVPGDDSYGFQLDPHITLLYGLHPEVTEQDVRKSLEGIDFSKIKLSVKGITLFKNPEFDVVKMDVKLTSTLLDIFRRLSKLPNSNSFPDFHPHITLCYVKSGTGKKYVSPQYVHLIDQPIKVVYSNTKDKYLLN